jgi:arabinofuranosyltransferase
MSLLQPARPERGFGRTSFLLAGLAAVVCIGAATYAVWRMLGAPRIGIDDANIFFVYARNFAQGHAIVYNVGGEHVEGFSSMLYFLICSAAYWLSPAPETALFWLNLLFAILTSLCLLYVIDLLAQRLGLSTAGKATVFAAYLFWLAINPAYFAWSVVTLMDSGIYSLLLTAGYTLLASLLLREERTTVRSAVQLGVLCALCVLVRPEGLGWALLQISGFAILTWLQTRSPRATLRLAAIPFAFFAVTWAALTGFREYYFGYPLPNTFYAKVTSSLPITLRVGGNGLHIFLACFSYCLVLPLGLAMLWLLDVLLRHRQRDTLFWFTALTVAFTLTGLLLPVLEGGDHFGASRMFQNVYPLLGLSTMLLLIVFNNRWNRGKLVCAMVLLAAFTTHATWPTFAKANVAGPVPFAPFTLDSHLAIRMGFDLSESYRTRGEIMDRVFAPSLPSIGVAAAGGASFTYRGPVLDLVGLNNSRMAHAEKIKIGPKDHQSFNARIFYDLAPDIVQPLTIPPATNVDLAARRIQDRQPETFDNEIFKDIFNEPRFRAEYILAEVRNPADPTEAVYGYFRKAYLDQLVQQRGFKLLSSAAL